MSTFQDRLRKMEEKYGSGAMGSAKTGTGSSGSSDKSTRYQSLLAEMDAKYGGGTTGSGSAASTSSGKPTRYQSILAEMDAKYGGTQPGTFGAPAQGSYQGPENNTSLAGSVFPYRTGYAALESDASIPGSGTKTRSAFETAMATPDKQKEFGADSQWWQEHKKRYSAISESPEYQTYIQGVQQAKADRDAEIGELEDQLAQLESQDKGFLLNLINGVDTMGMVQDRATIEQKIKQLKEDSGRDDLSVRTEVEDLLHENRINLNYMTDDQWRMMGYLYKKYPDYADRRKAILDYASYIAYDINAREQQRVAQRAQNQAGSGFTGGALATVEAIGSVPFILSGYNNAVSQFLSNKAIGEDRPVDYYTPSMSPYTFFTSAIGTVSKNLNQAGTIQLDEKEHPLLAGILNGKGLGDVYQLGVSMADSVAIAALTKALGLPEEVGAALLGGSAATQGMLDALDRGATDGQALTMGFLNGAFEMLFEKYSIGELIKDVPSYTIKDVVKEALKQSGVEAWEEGMTTIGNTLADVLVMEDKSELETMIREYKRQGYSDAEAQALAAGRIVGDILMDATGGFISGGIMGGVYRGVQTNQGNRQAGKQVLSSNTLSQMQDLASRLDSESLRESASAVTDSSGTGKIGAFARKVADTAVQDIQNASTETEATEAYRKTGNVSSDSFARSAFDLAYLEAAQKIGFSPDAFVEETTNQQFGADGPQKAPENHTVDDSGSDEQTPGGNASDSARGAFEQYYEEAHSPDIGTGAEADSGTGSENKNPVETASMERAHMRNLLKSGSVDAETADWILKNPEFRKAFEAETGITVTGTEEQQKNLVMNAAALYAERESIRNPNQTTQVDDTIRKSMKSSGEALGYSGDTLTGFVAGYRGNISAEEYRDAYNGFYTYGKLAAESGSLSFDRAVNSMSVYARRLGNPAAMAAFNRGKADATSSRTARTAHRPAKKGTGTFTDKTTSGKKRQGYGALVNTLEKFSKKTGIDVELVDSLKSGKYKANGRILLDTMTIQLAADGDNPLAALGHEAGEYLLAYNPEGYAQVREQLLSWWVEHENANSIDALIKAYQERYQNAGQAGKTWNEAANEAVNDALGAMLTTDAGMERFVQWVQTDSGMTQTEQKNLFQKIGDMIRSVIDGLKKLLEGSKDTPMQKRILEMEINKQQEILDAFLKAVDGTKVTEAQKNTATGAGKGHGTAYSISAGEITPGMDDESRAEVLNGKVVTAPEYDASDPVTGAQIIKLKGQYARDAKKILKALAEHCGVFDIDYYNADIELEFTYTRSSLSESINKQVIRHGSMSDFGKMLTVLPGICSGAVEVDAQTDRYSGTKRADPNLKEMHILVGAFLDGERVVPVKLEIKEYKKNSERSNRLYVSITAKMEAGIYLSDRTTNTGGDGLSTPASEISLAYIVGNVKDQTGSFVKYFPDSMLSGEQIQAKEAATTAEKTHLADMRYEYAAERGDVETTSRMLSDRASQMGYSTDTGWRMSHRAPNQESGVSLDKADSAFGGDGSIYASMAVQYFGEGRAYDRKALSAISRAKNNPNAMVTAYRAVPNSVQETQLRNGDWVTLTREYAQEHGERTFDGGFRVISQRVPASHLFTNGDSIHEFGYDNGRTDEVYKNTANGRKMTSVTYDDFGNLIPLSARFDDTVSDPRYSLDVPEPGVPQEQQDAWESVFNADSASREAYNDMSSEVEKAERAAAEAVRAARKQGLAEGDLLGQMYRGRIEGQRAASLEERLRNAKEVIRSLRQQISDAEKKGRSDSRSIERLKRDLSRQESSIDASRKRLADYREGRNERDAVAKGRLSVEKKAKALAKMLTTNTDKAHVPEDLKDAIGQLLQSLDFSSKQFREHGNQTHRDMDYDAMMTKVRNALSAHNKFDGNVGAWMDLPDGFLESIQKHIDTVKDSVRGISGMQTNQVYRMNSVQLADLAHILTVVKTSLENINAFYVQGRKQTVTQAADSTIRFAKKHGSAAGNPDGWLRRQLEWDNTVPIYAFSRFGDGGNQVFQGTQDGWDKLSFNVRKILDFKKGVFTDQEAQEWGKQLHEITLESGDVVTMSTAQIMSIVCLSKRSQAVQHMMQGGIRIANIQVDGKPGKADTLRQATNYNLTLADLNNIGKLLTDKQKSVAMEIQKFMEEQGSEWGNEVSMRRFGYRAFTESNYFPIASDPTNLPAVDPKARKNDMFRLMNLSATKATMEKANNAIVISNIFEVFGDHMADMAKYNALTLPILDMMKWYNYVDRVEGVNGQYTTRSVQRSILDAYGEGAGNYITTFLKDLNGIHEFGRGEGFMSKFVSNYKAAAVGANLRVAILQPTAYPRAWVVMDAGYLRRGLRMSARKGAAEMERYSGIGNWKAMGFYDTNVNRGIRQQLSGEGTAMDTVRDKSMVAAELMDKLTWGALWNACKLETMEKQGLSGEELMRATALRFREIVYKTQVVDSTMTRSQNMRSGSMAMKFATAFMSEPTLSYNLVMDAYLNFRDAQRSGTNLEKGNARKRMVRSFAAYAVSALAGAIMESLADALRDDDDYESYLRKFWEAFWGWDGNLVSDIRISNKIPFFKDIASIFGGNTVDRMDLASFHDLKEAWDIWKETVELAIGKLDKPTSVTYYGNMTTYGKIYKALRAISGLSGIPLASSTREVITLWNNTAGILYPDLKVKTYNAGDEKEILNALEDGYITADAAVQLLTEKVKDEKTGDPMSADDAYWKVKQIVTGYGKTGELEAALESGDEQHIQDCVGEMLAHGFEEKDIPGKITSAIRDLYTNDADGNTGEGRISREQAQNLLREYAGKEEKDIFWNLQVWDQILDGVEDAGKYRELYDAVSTGKNLKSTVKFYLDNGIGKDTLSQRLSDEFRETYTELYRTDRSAADAMKRNLLDAYEALGYDRKEKEAVIAGWVYDGKLSDALESGNDKSIQSTIKSMVADGYDEQDVPGKVSSLVKALYTKDSNGEIGSGRISRDTVKKLLTTYADMDETDVFWALRDWDRIAAGETNVNRYDDLHQAVSTGKSIQQTVKFYLDNGIGKSTLSQNLTSTYKQQYIDLYYSDPKAASALKKRLLDAYVAMGYDRSKKAKVIDGWIADAKD